MPFPKKSDVIAAIIVHLDEELAALDAITAAARDEATHEQSRPENQYDTRALEASYLAAGQGARLTALHRLRGWVAHPDRAQVNVIAGDGALVRAKIGGQRRDLLLGPAGGPDVLVGETRVQLISTRSPLGAALVGLAVGDATEVDTPRGLAEVEVTAVT